MCGRYSDTLTWDEMVRLYRLTEPSVPPNIRPRYNIAPTQEAAVVRPAAAGGRALSFLRWGLIPAWSRDATVGARLINARGETLAEKPSFRDAFRARRCLVPADGFFEWRSEGGGKQPYRIALKGGGGFAFAGLWERWNGGEGGSPVESFTIVTTAANDLLRPLHERMPVILAEEDHAAWLDTAGTPPGAAQTLIKPFPNERLSLFPVSRRVNSVRNDDPECIAAEQRLL